MTPKPPEKKLTWVQIYTAIMSTVAACLCGIAMNFAWEMKQWKGTKDEVDIRQDGAITAMTILQSKQETNQHDMDKELTRLSAIMPKEQPRFTIKQTHK